MFANMQAGLRNVQGGEGHPVLAAGKGWGQHPGQQQDYLQND